MNWDRIEGSWKQFAGNTRRHWGNITDNQSDVIEGTRNHLAGKTQRLYGVARDEADRQLAAWKNPRKASSAGAVKSILSRE